MSELTDVSGGETIAAAFTNQVKERTSMRYASQAALDTSIPAPVAGSVAYLQDINQLQYYNGTDWIPLLIFDNAALDFLQLDASNDPLTGVLRVDSPTDGSGLLVKAGASLGSGGGVRIGANQATEFAAIQGNLQDGSSNSSGGVDFMTRRLPADGTLTRALELRATGNFRVKVGAVADGYSSPTSSQFRNTTISTSAPTGGLDGDIWMQFT